MTVVNMENIVLQKNDGSRFDLFEYQGKNNLLLIFFRGAWCGHCKKQLSGLQKRLSELEKMNCKVVAISGDSKLKSSLLKNFFKLDFQVLADENFSVIDKYNLKTEYKSKPVAKPAVFLYNSEHQEVFSYIGEDYDDRLSADTLIEKIAEYR